LATIWNVETADVRRVRKAHGVEAVFKLVDTCAAEFEAYTPYYYSTYEAGAASPHPQPLSHKGRGEPEGFLPSPLVGEGLGVRGNSAEDETRPPSGKPRIMIL